MKGRLLPPLGLLVLVSLTLAAGLSRSQVFFYRDLTAFFYPIPELAWRMIRAGQLPLWNPYSAFGTPLAAMADVLLFYPGSWLRFLLPFPFGFNFHIIMHFYLAALATYALARKLEMSRAAAFTAALAYALSGPLLSLGSMINVLVSASWMPVVLLAARYAVERPSALRILALGASLGMQAIGGEPLFNLAAAVLAFPLCAVSIGRFLRVLVPAAFFGMALIAVQLIPGLELLRDSVRQSNGFGLEESSYWSLHPLNLLECLAPEVMFEQSQNPFRLLLYGATAPYLASLYLGLLPLGLAFWALMQSGRKQVEWVAAICLGSVGFALGQHAAFFAWFHWVIPFVKSSRYPSKTMVVLALGVALLAGWGLDCLRERRPLRWGWAKWAAAFAIGLVLQLILTDRAVVAWAAHKTLDLFSGALGAVHGTKLAALVLLLGMAVLFGPRRPRAAIATLMLALSSDLVLTGFWVNPTAPAELLTQRLPAAGMVGGGSSDFRVTAYLRGSKPGLPVMEGWSTPATAALESRLLLSFGAPLEGVRDARDLSPNRLYAPVFQRFGTQVLASADAREFRFLGQYNVRYVVTQAGLGTLPGLRQVAEVPTLTRSLAVWEIEGWRPRAEIEGGSARIVEESPTRVAVQVESSNGGRLLLRDRYHRGWKAWVDGAATTVHPQGLFRTVQVPQGGHRVEFAYRPWTFFAGAAISAAAVLAWVLAAAVSPRVR